MSAENDDEAVRHVAHQIERAWAGPSDYEVDRFLADALVSGESWCEMRLEQVARERGDDYAIELSRRAIELHERRKAPVEPCEGCYCSRSKQR